MTNTPPKPKAKVGLKINNANSMFANQPKKPTQRETEQIIGEIKEQENEFKVRALELAHNFKKMIDNKTIPTNINQFQVDLERDIINQLAQLGIDMNNDEYEQVDGMGSIGLSTLLFRCMIIQRDKINQLSYDLESLGKIVKKLESKLIDEKKTNE